MDAIAEAVERIRMMNELNCMNCRIGDFKHSLCDCDSSFYAKYREIGTEQDFIDALTSAQSEIIRCKDCSYGYLYIDDQNGVVDTWIECRNPEGLHRDASIDEYCSASTRRK